jgi:hypothetical protein
MNRGGAVEVTHHSSKDDYDGPVDLDALFQSSRQVGDDDGSLFSDDDDDDDSGKVKPLLGNPKLFSNPHRRLLDKDASQIPGSPFSKPRVRRSNRPSEPLAIAKYASTWALVLTLTWLAALFWVILDNRETSVGQIVVEVILTVRFDYILLPFEYIFPSCLLLFRSHIAFIICHFLRPKTSSLPLWACFGIVTF